MEDACFDVGVGTQCKLSQFFERLFAVMRNRYGYSLAALLEFYSDQDRPFPAWIRYLRFNPPNLACPDQYARATRQTPGQFARLPNESGRI